MMTFTEDLAFDREQAQRFKILTTDIEARGIPLGRLHAASTYTLFQHGRETWFDMARVGMALLGIYPEPKFKAMKVAGPEARAGDARARRVREADWRGRERRLRARLHGEERPTWIATLPVGHADGWPRLAAKGGRIRINGRMYPVIASVSASHTLVEIGDTPAVKAGDVATLFDWEDGSRPEDVAAATGASVYDLTMHLSPLLPRTVIS